MIKLGHRYTIAQVREMLGDDYFVRKQAVYAIAPKPRITSFDQFNERDQQIYRTILDEVIRCNPAHLQFKVYATGSRVNGSWRTEDESKELATQIGRPIKYSDYDWWTDAPNRPLKKRLDDLTGVSTDCVNGAIRVLIPTR